jgi:hypothetical protein
MLATNVVCPNCSRTLKTATPLPVGRKVLCRQCGTTFGVQPGAGPTTPAPVKGMSIPAGPPAAPVAAATESGGMSKGLLFAGIICAVVLAMFAGSAAVIAFAAFRNRPPDRVANAHDTLPAPGPGEGDKTGDKLQYGPAVPNHPDLPEPVVHQEEKPWLPKEEQEKVNKAIERGVEYLRKQQHPNGSWTPGGNDFQAAGLAALPALTLLECGAKADDPQVQKAAELVRSKVKDMTATYELALCILFLDRLSDSKDRSLIQSMALRLIAGQMASGGWSYNCPVLSDKDERDLLEVLQDTRPARVLQSTTNRTGDKVNADRSAPKDSNDRTVPKDGNDPNRLKGVTPPPGNLKGDKPPASGSDQAPGDLKGDRTKPAEPSAQRATLEKLSPALKNVPALKPAEAPSRPMPNDNSDNSNTQFAILAIWVAGRQDVPTESTCALIDRRFRTSQGTGGNWGYNYQANSSTPNGSPAMTCAGLLGLAVGHGVNNSNAGDKQAAKESLEDDAIKKGFKYLSQHLGKSQQTEGKQRVKNHQNPPLYFLWSVERVGVMYNLRAIGDKDAKDWYGWGSEVILDHQNNDGSWHMGGYHGSTPQIDTCFALLFLTRANLAKDLSTKIEYLIDIKGIGNRN